MTDVMLVKDCGLYPSYKKIIDFTGTKSEIIQKQLAWLNNKDHTTISDVNYNKFQNKLVLEMDYEEALTYTYVVMQNITGTADKPMFFFIQDVENLTNGIENESPNVAINLSLDPIMTYMGDYHIDETMVVREHVDRWKSDSNLPIRITPNVEGSYGFTEYDAHNKLKVPIEIVGDLDNFDLGLVVISYVESTGNIKYYAFPVNTKVDSVTGKIIPIYYRDAPTVGYRKYPTLDDIKKGDVLDWFNLQPDSTVSICYYPLYSEAFSVEVPISGENWVFVLKYKNTIGEIKTVPCVQYNTEYAMMVLNALDFYQYGEPQPATISVNIPLFEKPTNISTRLMKYEPCMFTDPFIKYTINDGINDLFDIPDNIILKCNGTLEIKVLSQISGTNGGTLLYIGDTIDEAIGNNCITFIPAVQLEVGNDLWRQYALTSQETDRQMVINNSIKNAIDNLVYMSYGGALVGSRSASDKPMFYPSMSDYGSFQYVNYKLSNNGVPYKGGIYPGSYKPPSLTPYGKRMVGATGLASGASLVTSLVDGKVAWENQKLYEQQIKNKASGLLSAGGASYSRIKSGQSLCRLIIRKIDSVNMDIGEERYFKFGYIVNKHEIPNTQSRKYFNYILTNGAIITGSINQTIRDVIASIFDAGVTIFHYDSGDTNTRNLEYTDKENIEVSLL